MKSKIKSYLTLFVVVSLMLVMLIPAFAEKSLSVKMNIVREDNDVSVSFSVPKNSDIGTIASEIKYDAKKLTYVSTDYLTGENILSKTNDKTKDSGSVVANFVTAEPLKNECTVFTLHFTVNDGAKGDTSFTVDTLNITDSENEPINVSIDGNKKLSLANKTAQNDDNNNNDTADDTNKDNSKLPTTSGKIIAYSTVAACIVGCVIGFTVIAIKRKKLNS